MIGLGTAGWVGLVVALGALAVCVTAAVMAWALGDDWGDPNEEMTP